MSAEDLRKQMKKIQERMESRGTYNIDYGKVNNLFLSDTNQLHQIYGEFVGKAKAEHWEYYNQITSLDNRIIEYFQLIVKVFAIPESCFTLINLASGKISELISYISTLNTIPPQEKVSKASYDKLLSEKEYFEKTAKFLAQYKGLPELNSLIASSQKIGLPIDENWALALCSSSLIEAIVNLKIEKLEIKLDGSVSFREKYKKLCLSIKEKENRDISGLLPIALYEGIRNKLTHASNSNKVTEKEAQDICKIVIEFMNEVFLSKQ